MQGGLNVMLEEWTTHWVVADGVRTRVVTTGSGSRPVTVLLHGTGGHAEAFARVAGFLAADMCLVAYDLPGHGWSSAPADRGYEVDGYVSHLLALLDALDIERADLVGVSLGGWVAARAALTAPARIGSLVLIAPGGVLADPKVMSALSALSTAAAADPTEQTVRARLEWLMDDPGAVDDELIDVRLGIYRRPGAAETMSRILCLQDSEIRARNLLRPEEWAAIDAPALVIWGSSDRTGPPEVGERLARWLHRGTFLRVAHAGHWPQYERPDVVGPAIATFLAKNHSDTAPLSS